MSVDTVAVKNTPKLQKEQARLQGQCQRFLENLISGLELAEYCETGDEKNDNDHEEKSDEIGCEDEQAVVKMPCPFPNHNGEQCGNKHFKPTTFREDSVYLLQQVMDIEDAEDVLISWFLGSDRLVRTIEKLVCSNHKRNELRVPLAAIRSWLTAKKRAFTLQELLMNYPGLIVLEEDQSESQDDTRNAVSSLDGRDTGSDEDLPIHTPMKRTEGYFSAAAMYSPPIARGDSSGRPETPTQLPYRDQTQSPTTPTIPAVFDIEFSREEQETPDSEPPSPERPYIRESTRSRTQGGDGSPSVRRANTRDAFKKKAISELDVKPEEDVTCLSVKEVIRAQKVVITQTVRKFRKQPSSLSVLINATLRPEDQKDGMIYIACDPSDEELNGHFKLGFTSNSISERYRSNGACKRPNSMFFLAKSSCNFKHAKRVEQLVLNELWNERYEIKPCRFCGEGHNEWLKAELSMIVEATNRWIRFVSGDIYNARGKLTPEGEAKLERIKNCYQPTGSAEVRMLYFSQSIPYQSVKIAEQAWSMAGNVQAQLDKVKDVEAEFSHVMAIVETWDVEKQDLTRRQDIKRELQRDWPKVVELREMIENAIEVGKMHDEKIGRSRDIIHASTRLDINEVFDGVYSNFSLQRAKQQTTRYKKTLTKCYKMDSMRPENHTREKS